MAFVTEGILTVSTDQTDGTTPFGYGVTPIEIEQSNPSSGNEAFDRQDATTTMPTPQTDAIEFRVVRPGVPVRRLRLTGNRYTFGSADGCSIRLNDPTLRPMHAVLIRDANRVLVRAYSVPLEINENRVTETCLQLGDVMRMGAYRFELLSGIDPAAMQSQIPDDAMHTPQGPVSTQKMLGDATGPTRFVAGIDARQQAIQARLERESAQWRSRQGEVDLRETRCIERESDLRAREAELWSRSEQVHRRESQLMSQEAAVLQIQEEFAARQKEVTRLRNENQVHRELLDERQSQIGEMESEYRQQVEEATRQLEQSQQQAESATEAVARMREQFTKLNEQLAHLISQQNQIEGQDEDHLEQHRRLRLDLEEARDEAIDARAESEARRQEAEARVEELTAKVNDYESRSNLFDEQVVESDSVNQQLREHIEELQQRVSEATDETNQLRQDYEGSCASVRQLELLVDQTSAERDDARDTLVAESDALRQSIQKLSDDLAGANEELAQLREANDSLTQELEQTQQARDEARSDAESRPTTEAFESLQRELEETSARLDKMQAEYDETLNRQELAQKSDDDSSSSTDGSNGLGAMANALAAGSAGFAAAAFGGTAAADDETAEDPSAEADDESAWPTYDSTPAESSTESDAAAEPEDISEDASYWRREGSQNVEQSSHLSSEESDDVIGVDPFGTNPYEPRDHYESSEDTTAEAADAPVWQDEAPEISVNEAIADIEQNVDQALADIESIAETPQDDGFEQSGFEATEFAENDSASDEPFQSAQELDDYEAINPWATDSQESEAPNVDEEETSSFYSQSPSEASDEDSFSNPVSDYQPTDATEQISEYASERISEMEGLGVDAMEEELVEEQSPGSLADMLIRDLGDDDVNEVQDEPSSTFVMDEPNSTFVMDEPPTASEEQGASWDLQTPEVPTSDVPDEDASSFYSETPAETDDYASEPESSYEEPETSYDEPETSYDEPENTYEEPATQYDSVVEEEPVAEAPEPEETPDDPAPEDDSIEAYMNRLLQRVQGDDDENDSGTPAVQSIVKDETVPDETESETTSFELTEEKDYDPNAPLVPRSQAPERNSNMDAMRELANQSARSAVARSVKLQARDIQINAFNKLAQAGVALFCAVLCFVFLKWGTTLKVLAIGSILVISAMLVTEAFALLKEAKTRIASAEASLPREDDEQVIADSSDTAD